MALKVLLVTTGYPYGMGEQFLIDELEVWAKDQRVQLIIAPGSSIGVRRNLPSNIHLCEVLRERRSGDLIVSMFKAAISIGTFSEMAAGVRRVGMNFGVLRAVVKSAVKMHYYKRALMRIKGVDIIYSYWNDEKAYAAATLVEVGQVRCVVSRAHGVDVYEERSLEGYMPFKRKFINAFAFVSPVSRKSANYMIMQYGLNVRKAEESRLGVALPKTSSSPSEVGKYHLLSVSSVIKLKRVDKIIDALRIASQKMAGIEISWVHIGDGPLIEEMISRANVLEGLVRYEFLGQMHHDDILNYYRDNKIDVFINCSETEGVPVSIMEAMAYEVPTIAPDVGGVSELVDVETGILLSESAHVDEISDAIILMYKKCKNPVVREMAAGKIKRDFNAVENHKKFISKVISAGSAEAQ